MTNHTSPSSTGLRISFNAGMIDIHLYDGWTLAAIFAHNDDFHALFEAATYPVPTLITYHTNSMPSDMISQFTRSFDMPFFSHPNAGKAYVIDPPPVGHGLLNILRSINPAASARLLVVESREEAYRLIQDGLNTS